MPTPPSEWAPIAAASVYYDVSEKTIRRWISAGLIDARRVGPRLIRVNLKSVEELGRPLSVRRPA